MSPEWVEHWSHIWGTQMASMHQQHFTLFSGILNINFFCILILLVIKVGFVVLKPEKLYCLSTDEKMWASPAKNQKKIQLVFSRYSLGEGRNLVMHGKDSLVLDDTKSSVWYHFCCAFFLTPKWTPVKFPHPSWTFFPFSWSRNDNFFLPTGKCLLFLLIPNTVQKMELWVYLESGEGKQF